MWNKVEAAVESIAASAGVFAQLAVLLAWGLAKAAAISLLGAVIIGAPLVAAYRWSRGSAARYALSAGFMIVSLTYLPTTALRRQRKWRERGAVKQ